MPDILKGLVVPADPARSAEQRAAVIDTIRTSLAAMVELQVTEARRIETELMELAHRTWADQTPADTAGYKRRWSVKK